MAEDNLTKTRNESKENVVSRKYPYVIISKLLINVNSYADMCGNNALYAHETSKTR
jgi:hypothetical protein